MAAQTRSKPETDALDAAVPGPQLHKGKGVPLTRQQRELVRIFIEYLQHLPLFDKDSEADHWRKSHEVVNVILFAYFQRRYWRLDSKTAWSTLSPEDTAKYHDLMYNAGSGPDPVLQRRRQLLEVARDKTRARYFIADYQESRMKAGLKPDPEFEFTRSSASSLPPKATDTPDGEQSA